MYIATRRARLEAREVGFLVLLTITKLKGNFDVKKGIYKNNKKGSSLLCDFWTVSDISLHWPMSTF